MRLFLAVDLDDAIRARIAAVQDRLRARLEGWRWVRPEGIHLTVRFLGEISPESLDAQIPAWHAAARSCSAVRVRLGGLSVFPPRGDPRVLWIGVEEIGPRGGLESLGRAFETAARDLGLASEDRPFRAHLTLARADRRGRPARPADPELGLLAEFEIREIVLFESLLLPGGARYRTLLRLPLGGVEDERVKLRDNG